MNNYTLKKLELILKYFIFSKPIIKNIAKRTTIVQFGTARSGSTLCYNAIRALVPNTKVIKVHHFEPKYLLGPRIVTTRDPYDSVVSMLEKDNLDVNDANLAQQAQVLYENGYETIEIAKKYGGGLFLQYEDFFQNYEYLLSSISEYLGVELDKAEVKKFVSEHAVEKIRDRVKDQPFSEWNKDDKYHGSHVSATLGQPGNGKTLTGRQRQIVAEILRVEG